MTPTRIVIGIAAIILIILGVVAFGQMQRDKNGASSQPQRIDLTDYTAGNTTVRMTTEGPLVANERHTSTVITVSSTVRSVEANRTYAGTTAASHDYPNNQVAYEEFIYGLSHANFTDVSTKKTDEDPRGYCPNGQRYVYELIQDEQIVLSAWSNSCNSKAQTFKGNGSLVQQLFQKQIPDYAEIVKAAKK